MTELGQLIKGLFPLEECEKYFNRKFDMMKIYIQPNNLAVVKPLSTNSTKWLSTFKTIL